MKREELIKFLEEHQRWRRGADVPMKQPKDIGIACDAVLKVLRDSDKDVVDFILRDFEFKHYGKG